MSLLGDIAAALSEGIGGGMIANAQWGIEEDKQAKKEAADDARLKEQMKRNDAELESRNKYYTAQLDESKTERAARAEQSRLDRESNERIAGMRERSSGGSGNISTVFKGLNLIDDKVTGYDKSISDLVNLRSEEMDPAKQTQIDAQIDFFKQQRQNFITSPAVLKVLDSSGEYGQLYKSSLFGEDPGQQSAPQDGRIPASLVVPPPRAVTKPSAWLDQYKDPSIQPSAPPEQTENNQQHGIINRLSRDASFVSDAVTGFGGGLMDKMSQAYNKPVGN